MNYRLITKVFNVIATILVVVFLLLSVRNFYFNENLLLHPEFFINYQGGFIRRGFDGHLLYLFTKRFHINFIDAVKIYNIIAFILFLTIVIYFKFKKQIPTFILFSSSAFLLYFVYLDRGLNNDHIVFLFIIAQSCFFWNERYLHNFWWKILFVCVGIVGTLIHEVFFVITFFPNIIGFWLDAKKKYLSFAKHILLILPSSILFILLITVFSGNSNQVEIIINSYQDLNYDLDYLHLLFSKSYYFWQQNYTFNQIALFLLMILLNGLFVSTATFTNLKNNIEKSTFLLLLLCQIVVLLILSMVAIDYGRWVMYCFASVLIFYYNYSLSESYESLNFSILNRTCKKLQFLPFVLFFFITIPHSQWNGKDGIIKNNILLQIKNKLSAE